MSLAKIQLSHFKYRKDNGDTSNRDVVIIEDGSDRLLALDVTGGDLTEVQPYLAYQAELEELKEHLKAKHGIDEKKLPYKSFHTRGISGRTDTTIAIDL